MGILLIPAAEITKGDLHFNALYVTEPNQFAGLDLTSALTAAKKQGAFLFWNLPHDAKMVLPIWGGIGLLIYFAYGYRKSHLGRGVVEVHETDGDVPPPPVPPIR